MHDISISVDWKTLNTPSQSLYTELESMVGE